MEAILPSAALALGLAVSGLRKGSLSKSGAAAAVLVGMLHMSSGFEFGSTLIVFYLSSSKLTKWRSSLKARLEAGHAAGGQRGAAQVLANSLPGAVLAAASAWLRATGSNGQSSGLLVCAFVGFYACCCSDTWSSEVGIAAKGSPRLITTGRRVPPGTNGGISLLGTAAAAAGGLLMGCIFCTAARLSGLSLLLSNSGSSSTLNGPTTYGSDSAGTGSRSSSTAEACWRAAAADWHLVPLALAAGLAGSLLDSLLGATLQWSGFDESTGKAVSGRPAGAEAAGSGGGAIKHVCGRDVLSNTGVNVCSSLLTGALAAAVGVRLLPGCPGAQ